MQIAVFLQRELVASIGFEFRHPLKAVAGWNITLAHGVIHDGRKNAHFDPDSGIADLALAATDAVLAPPQRIFRPAFLTDQVNLGAADIGVERPVDLVPDIHRSRLADLASLRAPLLCVCVFLCHLRKGPIEYGNVVLHPKANIGILIHCTVARRLPIRRAQ
ncbi:hypothetical protein D9M73_155780 [compost metagenome]